MNPLATLVVQGSTQVAPPDTVLFFAAAENLDRWADIAVISLTVLFLVLVVVGIAAVLQLRRMVLISQQTLNDLKEQLNPVTDRAAVIADNLGYISAMVRNDVERLSSTVGGLTARLDQASDRVEERIEEFNALLEVAQNEAEDLFIDTASTVRGVKAGAQSLGRGPDAPEPGVDEPDEGGP